MSEAIQKILVLGSGAIGCFYGARLAKAGFEVSFVVRSDYEAVAKGGIRIHSFEGDFQVTPAQVVARPEDYQGQADLVLVATKVLAEIDLPELIAPLVHPKLKVLLVQNGIDIEAPLAAAYPRLPLLSAIAFVGVGRTGPGQVHHQLKGNLEVGAYPGGFTEELDQVMACLSKTGLEVKRSPDICLSRWKKLVWNGAFNPVSVLTRANTEQMLQNPKTEALLRSVMFEVVALARAKGYDLEDRLVEQNLSVTYKMPPYKTSMLLDFEAHRHLETEAILGNPLKIAKSLNVPVPHLETLAALIELVAQVKKP